MVAPKCIFVANKDKNPECLLKFSGRGMRIRATHIQGIILSELVITITYTL